MFFSSLLNAEQFIEQMGVLTSIFSLEGNALEGNVDPTCSFLYIFTSDL